MFKFMRNNDNKPTPLAAGRFGIAADETLTLRSYRPAGCPSQEQFAARFRIANDRNFASRAA